LFATAAFALDPQKAITQFVHTAWTEKDGAPADIRSITQTKDGYLWLGTQTGLFSIDGTRFARFEPRAGEGLPTTHTRMLLATRDGSLWIVFFSGILRIGPRGDHEVVSRGGTLSMFEDEGGVLWRRSVLGPENVNNPMDVSLFQQGRFVNVIGSEHPLPGA
jgi:ligand-binding sensor domain-containing protein